MEQPIERLKRLSAELVARLPECEMEDFDSYMAEREQIFGELMQRNLQPSEHKDAKLILQLDKQIIARMMELKVEAAGHLDKVQQGQKTRSVYDNAGYGSYGGNQEESFFFDRRR
ncbi:hypothetical protein [Paenibacillus methanolicus]|uniref:Flagellar protein FliT n=1 Tax=Paenibacillus methanolicus TaxID=582686 RepID=A0A5S5C8L4_9BACL|nr:hypothetical protein [Paenibacillus methanolicus]TYP75745.1 hypothetical protein BCM02_104426 [Paenibacillus methanolicus]